MTSQELLETQEKIDELYALIKSKVHPDIMPLINKYSNLQLEIEKECNQ